MSKFIFSYALAAAAIGLALVSLLDFRVGLSSREIKDFKEQAENRRSGNISYLSVLEHGANLALAKPETLVSLGQEYARRAEGSNKIEQKLKLLCQALSSYGLAIKRQPFSSDAMVHWANMRQLLGQAACSEPYTNADFTKVLDFALAHDPSNMSVSYAAGLINLWAGRKEQAYRFFRYVLTYSPRARSDIRAWQQGIFTGNLTPQEEQFILGLIQGEEELQAIIPARFPQIARWSKLLSESKAVRSPAFMLKLSELQLTAIDGALAGYREDRFRKKDLEGQLNSLNGYTAAALVRKRVDFELSALKPEGDALGNYLRERSSLDELDHIAALHKADFMAKRSVIANWGRDEFFYLDEYYNTLGFVVPEGVYVKVIELAGREKLPSSIAPALRFFGSQDNYNWEELNDKVALEGLSVEDAPLLVIRPKRGDFRYWKMNYGNAARARTFGNKLSAMLRVFGQGGGEK
jgi:hypothetical protein